MPNILINPNSGIMEFSTGVAGGSSFIPNLNFTGGSSYSARLTHDNFGGLNIVSYTTGSGIAYSGIERFSIDGNNGRLFSITDNLSGSLFSVNDIAGLPIIEAFDDNTVVMGAFNRNDFVLTGNSLGLGGLPNTGTTKLYISGNTLISGNLNVSGKINNSGMADIFPASTGIRRYFSEAVGTLGTVTPSSGFAQYFPFLIKKDIANYNLCIEATNATPTHIRLGIYSASSGMQNAPLIWTGTVFTNTAEIYRISPNVPLTKGPYIIASCNTGTASAAIYRSTTVNNARVLLGEPTGNINFTSAAANSHYYSVLNPAPNLDLLPRITGEIIGATSIGPLVCVEY